MNFSGISDREEIPFGGRLFWFPIVRYIWDSLSAFAGDLIHVELEAKCFFESQNDGDGIEEIQADAE